MPSNPDLDDEDDDEFKNSKEKSWSDWKTDLQANSSDEYDSDDDGERDSRPSTSSAIKTPIKLPVQEGILENKFLGLILRSSSEKRSDYFSVTQCPVCKRVFKAEWFSRHVNMVHADLPHLSLKFASSQVELKNFDSEDGEESDEVEIKSESIKLEEETEVMLKIPERYDQSGGLKPNLLSVMLDTGTSSDPIPLSLSSLRNSSYPSIPQPPSQEITLESALKQLDPLDLDTEYNEKEMKFFASAPTNQPVPNNNYNQINGKPFQVHFTQNVDSNKNSDYSSQGYTMAIKTEENSTPLIIPNPTDPLQLKQSELKRTGGIFNFSPGQIKREPIEEISIQPKEGAKKRVRKKSSAGSQRKVIPLKDRHFDPDQHCGVGCNGDPPCKRSLTCKTHSISFRRAVKGRSMPFDKLLENHKRLKSCNKIPDDKQWLEEESPTPLATSIMIGQQSNVSNQENSVVDANCNVLVEEPKSLLVDGENREWNNGLFSNIKNYSQHHHHEIFNTNSYAASYNIFLDRTRNYDQITIRDPNDLLSVSNVENENSLYAPRVDEADGPRAKRPKLPPEFFNHKAFLRNLMLGKVAGAREVTTRIQDPKKGLKIKIKLNNGAADPSIVSCDRGVEHEGSSPDPHFLPHRIPNFEGPIYDDRELGDLLLAQFEHIE